MQVILDSPFARPVSVPMWGAGRKESSGTGLLLAMNKVKGFFPSNVLSYDAVSAGCFCQTLLSQRKGLFPPKLAGLAHVYTQENV